MQQNKGWALQAAEKLDSERVRMFSSQVLYQGTTSVVPNKA
jgi:hypothetical protein